MLLVSYASTNKVYINDRQALVDLSDADLYKVTRQDMPVLNLMIKSGLKTEALMNLLRSEFPSKEWREHVLNHNDFIDWSAPEPREGYSIGFDRFVKDIVTDKEFAKHNWNRLGPIMGVFLKRLVISHAQEISQSTIHPRPLWDMLDMFALYSPVEDLLFQDVSLQNVVGTFQNRLPTNVYLDILLLSWNSKRHGRRLFKSSFPKDKKAMDSFLFNLIAYDKFGSISGEFLDYMFSHVKPSRSIGSLFLATAILKHNTPTFKYIVDHPDIHDGISGSFVAEILSKSKYTSLELEKVAIKDLSDAELESVMQNLITLNDFGLSISIFKQPQVREKLNQDTCLALVRRFRKSDQVGSHMFRALVNVITEHQDWHINSRDSLMLVEKAVFHNSNLQEIFNRQDIMMHIPRKILASWFLQYARQWDAKALSAFLASELCLRAVTRDQLLFLFHNLDKNVKKVVVLGSLLEHQDVFPLTDSEWNDIFEFNFKKRNLYVTETILKDSEVRSRLSHQVLVNAAAHIEALVIQGKEAASDYLKFLFHDEIWPITKELFDFVDWASLIVLYVLPRYRREIDVESLRRDPRLFMDIYPNQLRRDRRMLNQWDIKYEEIQFKKENSMLVINAPSQEVPQESQNGHRTTSRALSHPVNRLIRSQTGRPLTHWPRVPSLPASRFHRVLPLQRVFAPLRIAL